MPAARCRNLFVKEMLNAADEAGAVLQPIADVRQSVLHALRLRGMLQFADQQLRAFNLGFEAVERARRGAGDHLAVDGENRVVAGAEEIVIWRVPVVSAAQMGATRAERDDPVVIALHHPGGALFDDLAPAIEAFAAENQFDRRIGGKLGDIAGFGPGLAILRFGWRKQINRGWRGEDNGNQPHHSVDGGLEETPPRSVRGWRVFD